MLQVVIGAVLGSAVHQLTTTWVLLLWDFPLNVTGLHYSLPLGRPLSMYNSGACLDGGAALVELLLVLRCGGLPVRHALLVPRHYPVHLTPQRSRLRCCCLFGCLRMRAGQAHIWVHMQLN